MAIQQMFLGIGAKVKTYLDDIFANTIYVGNEATTTDIATGIDVSAGGMIIGKSRGGSHAPFYYDTLRGVTKYLRGDVSDAEVTLSTGLKTFGTNGFSVGSHVGMNDTEKQSAWSFKKTEKFFDVVTYTGNGTAGNTISHSLGCVPGLILIKNIDADQSWQVYHRDLAWDGNAGDGARAIFLDLDNDQQTGSQFWNNTAPTDSQFTLGTDQMNNGNNVDYVAYLFAGGESTAATARCVYFDGNTDTLTVPDSTDLDVGTGSFTAECWFKQTGTFTNYRSIFAKFQTNTGLWLHTGDSGQLLAGINGSDFITSPNNLIVRLKWYHVAVVKDGTVLTLYLNGKKIDSITYGSSVSGDNDGTFTVGDLEDNFGRQFQGYISNVRFTVGQALYTSSFRPTTEPLTTTSQGATSSNVKLLFCNNSSVTGSTATTGTITDQGSTTASSHSPFDDPKGFAFGDSQEGVVKCGSYRGTGATSNGEIYIGWEPEWILIKRTSGSAKWVQFDAMRGVTHGGNDSRFRFNTHNTEYNDDDFLELSSTGFYLKSTGSEVNQSGEDYIYVAIRRPDGYVGKPIKTATDVFAIDTGTATSDPNPSFDATFEPDFGMLKHTTNAENWHVSARHLGQKYLVTNSNTDEASGDYMRFDLAKGWATGWASTHIGYMWKRHAGFDVVAYRGTGRFHDVPHSLGRKPEMVWVKRKNGTGSWVVSHIGLNGGTNSMHYYIELNSDDAETDGSGQGNKKFNHSYDHTATHIAIGNNSGWTNADGGTYLAMAFASVNGISKVGYYTGSSSNQTITTGFQPRFVIIRSTSSSRNWCVFDTTRGWGSGNDQELNINKDDAQGGNNDRGAPTSTGFTVVTGNDDTNNSGHNYIYYAHA